MPATAGSGERPAERGNPACAPGAAPFRGTRLPANGSSRGDDGIRLCGANRRDGGGARPDRLQGSREGSRRRNFGLRETCRFRRGSGRHGGESGDRACSFGARHVDVFARCRARGRSGCAAAAAGVVGHSSSSMALPSLRTKQTVRPSKTAFMSMSGYHPTSFSIRLPTTRNVPGASERLTT